MHSRVIWSSKRKIGVIEAAKILRLHARRDALERIVAKAAAAVAGGNDPFFSAEIGFLINLAGMHAIGAKPVYFFSKQHFRSPLLSLYLSAAVNVQPFLRICEKRTQTPSSAAA